VTRELEGFLTGVRHVYDGPDGPEHESDAACGGCVVFNQESAHWLFLYLWL
jgi:hypothetical protein